MFPDFSRPAWRSLETDQRAAAIAAAGVLTRYQERALIEGTGIQWFDHLMDVSNRTRGQLSWVEPRVLADIDDSARLEALAEVWWRSPDSSSRSVHPRSTTG